MDWPLRGKISQAYGYPTGSAYIWSLNCNASAHTKGTWTEMIASLAYDSLLDIRVQNTGLAQRDYLFDIAIGSSGNEEIILPDIYYSIGGAWYYAGEHYPFGIYVPAGTRIAGRCQSTTGGQPIQVAALAYRYNSFGGPPPYQKAFNYGADTTDTGGKSVDPGGTINTKGSWVELTSSCDELSGLMIQVGGQRNTARQYYFWHIDIGIGGAGNEEVIVFDYPFCMSQTLYTPWPTISQPIWIPIPSGTRIAARSACDGADSLDRLLDIMVIGLS